MKPKKQSKSNFLKTLLLFAPLLIGMYGIFIDKTTIAITAFIVDMVIVVILTLYEGDE